MSSSTTPTLRGPYSAADESRWAPEGESSGRRTPFVRDRARVLHCWALRRLAGKTQVIVAGESDVPRTRLTHSLEVAQVARELGQALGCDPDVVDVAGLAHDLGHPPFGHNGESALNEFASECGGFEGNAQTFRILTRLEAKVTGADRSVGLNLTRAVLDACLKYPYLKSAASPKFGAYDTDREIFDWVRESAPPSMACMEAQVMDWADDVAYSVHDLDDAIALRHLDPALLEVESERLEVASRCIEWYLPDADREELVGALDRLRALPAWVGGFDGSMGDLAAVKRMTSDLIGRFCNSAELATRERFGAGPLSRYAGGLIVPTATRHEVAMMKAVAAHYVMLRPGAESGYVEQRRKVQGVAKALLAGDGSEMEAWLRPAWETAENHAERLRAVVDQVASLTDGSLVEWHRRLCRV